MRTYPGISEFEMIKISELKRRKPATGYFNIEGYLVKIYKCPPCPPGVNCKPCMGDNIVVSELDQLKESYDLTEKDLIIFVTNPDQFIRGKRYYFSFGVTDRRTTNEALNDLNLIGYELIN